MANPFSLYDDEQDKLLDISQFAVPSPYEVYNNEVPMPDSIVQRFRGLASATEKSPEQKALEQAQEQAYQQSVKNQEALIPQLERNYQDYGNSQEKDISGILGAVDLLGGTNTLAKYQKPDSPDDVAYKKALLGQMVQKAKEGVTETQLKRLGQIASNKNVDTMAKIAATQGRFDYSKNRDAEKQIIEATRKDIVKPTEAFNKLYTEIDSALASGDIKRIKGALNQVARGIQDQKGVLTEGDIGRVMFPQISTDTAEFLAYLGSKEKLDPGDVEYIKQGVDKSKAALGEMSRANLKAIENDYGTSETYGHLFKPGGSLNRVIRNREKDLDRLFGAQEAKVGTTKDKPPPVDEMVSVIHPDGRTGKVPKKNLDKALKQGFSVQ